MGKIKKLTYFMAVYADEDGGAWTSFADFDCLCDQGDTVDEAIARSADFLDYVVTDMINRNKQLPVPSGILDFLAKLNAEDGEPMCIIPVTVYPPSPTKRINITGKEDVFARIDDYAKAHHVTRSELMINATLEYMRLN